MKLLSGYRTILGSDLRTLALYRVGLALLLIADLINRASHSLVAHYTDFGMLPRSVVVEELSTWRFSFHLINGTAVFQGTLFILAGLFATALLVGYKTRLATIISWVMLLSLQNRNFLVLQGGDDLLLMLLFWGMFLPLGARYSVDAVVNPQLGRAPVNYFSIASMALKIQCMSVYFFSAWLKTGSEWIPDGSAIYYALSIDQLTTPLGLWFVQFGPLLTALSIYVWHLQMYGPVLMFSPLFHIPLRLLMMFCFITLHISFLFFLEIGLFPYISIVSLLAFTPTVVWEKLADFWHKHRIVQTVYYNNEQPFAAAFARGLCEFTFHGDLQPVAASPSSPEANQAAVSGHIAAVDREGRIHHGRDAVKLLLKSSLLLRPFTFVFAGKPARFLFLKSANGLNQAPQSALSALNPSSYDADYASRESKPVSLAVGFFLLYVLYTNIATLPQNNLHIPESLKPVSELLKLNQIWNMFAPYPVKGDGWYVIEGRLLDGTNVDVFRNQPVHSAFDKPKYVSQMYPNQRWRKTLMRMWNLNKEKYWLHFGRYLCRDWNHDRRGPKQLASFNIYFNLEWTLPGYQTPNVERKLLWSHNCFRQP